MLGKCTGRAAHFRKTAEKNYGLARIEIGGKVGSRTEGGLIPNTKNDDVKKARLSRLFQIRWRKHGFARFFFFPPKNFEAARLRRTDHTASTASPFPSAMPFSSAGMTSM